MLARRESRGLAKVSIASPSFRSHAPGEDATITTRGVETAEPQHAFVVPVEHSRADRPPSEESRANGVPQLATGPVVVSRGRVKEADVVEIDRRRQGKLEAPGLGRRGSRVRDEIQTAPFWFGSFCVPWDTPASPAGGRGDGNAFVLRSLARAKPS